MEGVSTDRMEHPVFYAGRFFEEVADAGLPGDHTVLNDWDVLPTQLSSALEWAGFLVVLDMFSFPFESLTGDLEDVPLILLLPAGCDVDFLATVFGRAVFSRLGFFDRIAVPGDDLWVELRRKYGFVEGQRLEVEDSRPELAASEIRAALEAEPALHAPFGGYDYEANRYRTERDDALAGDAFAGDAAHRAICSVGHGPRFDKAIHRVQAKALGPQFDAARGIQAEGVPFDVLEVGAGVGRWAASFDQTRRSSPG